MNALPEKHDGALADLSSVRLWLRLLSCTMTMEKRLRRGFASRFETTLPRFDVMAALDRCPAGLRMSDLSRQLLVSNGNVTGVVQSLRSDGFVEVLPVAGDRRASLVRLTAAGRSRFAELAQAHHGWVDTMLADLRPGERQALHELLGRLKLSLASGMGEADGPE